MYKSIYNSPVGKLYMVSDGKSLVGLWIEGQKYFYSTIDCELTEKDLPVFDKTKNWLDRYFRGEKPSPKELYLAPQGSDFRQCVWKILCEIPYGKTCTYSDIAKKFSDKMSAQAIGGAVGHNPISIIIPCHRVLGKNGSLTGYAGGLDIKEKLLKLENVKIS